MYQLRTLGQLDLSDSAGQPVRAVLVQPKRFALLAYLAVASPRGFQRRDLLLALFWPELADSRGRNALRQAVHQLRHVLGGEVIASRGSDAIGIDEARLSCDAATFETNIDRGDFVAADALYKGDLLPGFGLTGSPQFETWLDETRARLRARAGRAAWALAEQRERSGQATAAVESARRAVTLTGDEGAVRQLIMLLDRLGDVPGAIKSFDDFATHLRRDLDAEPSLETRALVESIRERDSQASLATKASSPAAPTSYRVSIERFENLTGNSADDFVGRLVSEGIAQGIAESRLVDVHGANGALEDTHGLITVTGSYSLRDDVWRFQALVRTARDGPILGAIGEVTALRGRPWEAADELRRRVCGILAAHLDPRFASWASAVSHAPSLDAQRELTVAVDLHLRGEFRSAIPRFLRAADPSAVFNMPLLWAMQASCNVEEYEQAEAILSDLTSRRGQLSPFEQLGCDYFAACLNGDRAGALRAARRASELVPDSEALAQLGREAIFSNQPRLAADALERLKPDRGWMPSWTPYWGRLTEAYHMLGDHARELEAARRGRRQHPEAISTLLYEARAHAALGNLDRVARCADEAAALPPDRFVDTSNVFAEIARELKAHGHVSASLAIQERASTWSHEREAERGDGSLPADARALAHYDAERWDDARTAFECLSDASPDDPILLGRLGVVAARQGDGPFARAAVAKLRAMTGRLRLGKHLAWSARICAVLGEHDDAVAHLRGAFARGYRYGIELHADPDLLPLNGHAGFRELLRAKG
jgi:DNA-binding SARP family transcriptional activator